ncbi:hypothetical protein [Streptomyces sp. GD-15H]|uniref:hypothetical protein n=1 Tax=Streptomyces sp. GD-15H TaxID=3129112 RepID=UPI00387337EF
MAAPDRRAEMTVRFALWDQSTDAAGPPRPAPLSPPKPKPAEPTHTLEHSLNLTTPCPSWWPGGVSSPVMPEHAAGPVLAVGSPAWESFLGVAAEQVG